MKTAPIEVTYVDHMGTDLSVVNAARVSFDKESEWAYHPEAEEYYLKGSDEKLINYLAKHKHYSPFNHTFLSFRIKAPIFVARQLVKHEYMPWNEVSRRYVDSEPEFYIPGVYRAKAENVKQGSSAEAVQMVGIESNGVKLAMSPYDAVAELTETAFEVYDGLLKSGVCPEQARMVLPLNTMTEWIWSGTLKAFHKMLTLRLDPHTQYESRIVAEKILPEIEKLFPVSIKSLMENN